MILRFWVLLLLISLTIIWTTSFQSKIYPGPVEVKRQYCNITKQSVEPINSIEHISGHKNQPIIWGTYRKKHSKKWSKKQTIFLHRNGTHIKSSWYFPKKNALETIIWMIKMPYGKELMQASIESLLLVNLLLLVGKQNTSQQNPWVSIAKWNFR